MNSAVERRWQYERTILTKLHNGRLKQLSEKNQIGQMVITAIERETHQIGRMKSTAIEREWPNGTVIDYDSWTQRRPIWEIALSVYFVRI